MSPSFQELDARLANWGRWASGSCGPSPVRCGSAERRYRPRAADDEAVARSVDAAVDFQDAELLERAVCSIMATDVRQLLTMVYVYRNDWFFIRRELNLRDHDRPQWEARKARCVFMVGDAIESLEVPLIKKGAPIWAGCTRRKVCV